MTSTATSTTTRVTTGISTRAITGSRHRARPEIGAAALLAVVAWTTFGFGGVYRSTLGIPGVICIGLAAAYRPWSYHRRAIPALHACLGVYAAGIAAQLLPLPPALTAVISPALRPTMAQLALALPSWLPLTIDARSTAETLLVNAALVVVFLVALRIFAAGGVRLVARGIAMIGLLLSLIALAQDATANGLMYWRWKPLTEGSAPFGPFVNRNHFATWVVLATPLAIGYLAAHSSAHRSRALPPVLPLRRRLVLFFDGRAMLLTASISLMVVALVATLSRSGLFGIASAAAAALLLRRREGGEEGRAGWWVAAAAAGAVALLAISIPFATILSRLARTQVSAADRLQIWKDTLPMLRDFWLTGTGAGTYETGMLVYQRASPGVRFNQAHNQYLQLGVEGGVLLGVPLVAALTLYVREAWRRVAAERSGMYWIRAGALCGLTGAAAQGCWETGLSTPANAALASVLAAIVVHEPRRY